MSLFRSITTFGGWTMVSRLLGFARDILMAKFLGAGPVADAFFAAFRFANLFRQIFSEGAFSAAFIPLYSQINHDLGASEAHQFASRILTILLITLIPFVITVQILMPWAIHVIAPGFEGDDRKMAMVIDYARIMFPFLLFMTLAGMLTSILNTYHRFAVGAMAPILLNIFLIVGLLMGQIGLPSMGHMLSWIVFAAGLAQVVVLMMACIYKNILPGFKCPWRNEEVKTFLKKMLPAMMGAGANQINVVLGSCFASLIPSAVSYLYYADRLTQLPLGVIGVAIGVVMLPYLTQAIREGNTHEAIKTQNRVIEWSLIIVFPAMTALVCLSEMLIMLLFQRGEFSAHDAKQSAMVLQAYAWCLPAYITLKSLNPCFFARGDTSTPVRFAMISTLSNLILIPGLMWLWGYVGIALATSVSAWINVILVAWRVVRLGYFIPDRALKCHILIILAFNVLMALGFSWVNAYYMNHIHVLNHFWTKIGFLFTTMVATMVLYACGLIMGRILTKDSLRAVRRPPKKPSITS